MLNELVKRVQDTQDFLKLAAFEPRRIAEQAPDIAAELGQVAGQLEAEAADLVAAMSNRRTEA
jgi:hypothetical protein